MKAKIFTYKVILFGDNPEAMNNAESCLGQHVKAWEEIQDAIADSNDDVSILAIADFDVEENFTDIYQLLRDKNLLPNLNSGG